MTDRWWESAPVADESPPPAARQEWWASAPEVSAASAKAPPRAPEPADTPFVERRDGTAGAFNKYIRTPAQRAAAGLAGLPGDITTGANFAAWWLANKALKATGGEENPRDAMIKPPVDIPGSGEIRRGIEGMGLPEVAAESFAGKLAQEGMTGAMSGGPFGRMATVLGGASAAASEGAGQLTEGSEMEPYARVAGAALPILAGAGYSATRMRAPEIVRDTVKGLDDAQIAQAQELMGDAMRAGIPITSAEAIAAVTGNRNSPMLAGQRMIENSGRTSAPVDALKGTMAERGGANVRAFDATVANPRRELSEIAPAVQQAGKGEIDAARRETNRLSKPAYDATTGDPSAVLSPATSQRLAANPGVSEAIQAARANPMKYGDLEGVPDNSIRALDAAKKYLDDLEGTATAAGERTTQGNIGKLRDDILDATDAEFPRYASARLIQTIRQRNVEGPLGRSATGKLAATEKLTKQFDVLFTKNPADVSPGQVRDAITAVAKADPDLSVDFVNRYLQRQFRMAQGSTPDKSRAAGNFAGKLFGDPDVGANVKSAVLALPDGGKRWQAFRRLTEIYEAQANRLPVGSPTEANRMLTEQVKGGGVQGAAKAVANPFGTAKQTLEWWRYGRNMDGLAKALTGDMNNLNRILKTAPQSERAAIVAASVLEGQRLTDKSGEARQ
jgi:hypothetical protein